MGSWRWIALAFIAMGVVVGTAYFFSSGGDLNSSSRTIGLIVDPDSANAHSSGTSKSHVSGSEDDEIKSFHSVATSHRRTHSDVSQVNILTY